VTAEEEAILKRYKIACERFKIAIDAVAVIVNIENPIAQIRLSQLDSIYRGWTRTWKEIGWKNSNKRISVCLPGQNSGEYEILSRKVLRKGTFSPVDTIAQSSPEMVLYVSKHPGALGVVSLSWLKQFSENSWLKQFSGKVKSLALDNPDAPDSLNIKGKFFGPYQAYVYTGYYPLTSEVTIYSRSDMYGVGSGFITFVSSVTGQKIAMEYGIVPATMPVRIVELRNKGL
jgi:ABC-type phosphate transport system substrate-binding protein